jgi:hypothetical protein
MSVGATLVEAYENDNVAISEVSEGDVLRELPRANGLSQSEPAKKTGIS